MIARRTFLAAALALTVVAGHSVASEGLSTAFTPSAFDAASASGKPVLVEISAPWCPTCRVQKAVLADLSAKPEFQDLVILEIDFDSQRDLVRQFGARSQSTLIMFKGGEETGRSVGDTDPQSIDALLRSAI